MTQVFNINSLADTHLVGQQISEELVAPCCVYLNGAMGAGKTTLAKSIIAGFGYQGDVTSPTYNLIQEYPTDRGMIFHMDLYRLAEPEELEYLAVKDLWSKTSIFLVEWAERGEGYLPEPTHIIDIKQISDDANDRSRRSVSFIPIR